MNRNVMQPVLVLLAVVVTMAMFSGGCANPIAPMGGPKDTLPPKLIAAVPKDSMLGFTEKRITFTFDEFVQLDNARENLVVSPIPKYDFDVQAKLKTVTVRIKDTLEPNTTYSINFGNAVKDVNEGNVKKNFTYVFSTGKYIDSLELTGNVIMAKTGKSDSTLIVILHRSGDDSALVKQRPRYFTKLDSAGRFHFRNLPPGTFYMYALEDQGGTKKYQSKNSPFAFLGHPVVVAQHNAPDTLYAYAEEAEVKKPATAAATVVKPPATKADKEKALDKRLKFAISLEAGQQDLLSNLEFNFAEPLKSFDSTKARLTDESFKTVGNYQFYRDTTNRKLILSYKWPENTAYNFIVDRDFAEDSAGRKIPRTDTLRFRTKKETDYGNLNIRFSNFNPSRHPVLQLLQSDAIKFTRKLTTRDFAEQRFKPGEYDLQILYDANNNGVWDAGEFFGKHRQPEHVQAIKKKIVVKANWDNGYLLDL